MPSRYRRLTVIKWAPRGPLTLCVVAAGLVLPAGCLLPVSAGSDLLPMQGDGGTVEPPAADAGAPSGDAGAIAPSVWSGPPEVFCYVDCFSGQLERGDGGDAWDAGGLCGDKSMFPPCTCARQDDGGVDFTCYWGCPPSRCFETSCGDVQCGRGTTCVERGRCE